MIITPIEHIKVSGVTIDGVCHIGCGACPDYKTLYESGIRNFILIDYNQTCLANAYSKISLFPKSKNHFFSALLWNKQDNVEYSTKNNHNDSGMSFFVSSDNVLKTDKILTTTAKELYRSNRITFDLDTHNMLRISTDGGEKEILEGFENLLLEQRVKCVVISRNLNNLSSAFLAQKMQYDCDIKSFLLENGFSLLLNGEISTTFAKAEDFVFVK
jgi:hypothetical protein